MVIRIIMSIRPILERKKSNQVLEGAGVRLDRAFGFGNTSDFDPFLFEIYCFFISMQLRKRKYFDRNI